jgi:peptidyl-prolyl cis-trans isomerase C
MRTTGIVAFCMLFALAGCKSCGGGGESADAGHAQTSSLTPEQAAKVLAKVGDKTITLGDYVAALEHMDQFDRLRYQSPERRKELLDELVEVELLAQEATAKGYDKDPVAQQQLRAVLRDAMLREARSGAPKASDISDADARAYYESHKADFKDPERRRLSLIVTDDEASAKTALARAKGSTAAQWGALVRQLSVDKQAKANVPVDLAGDFGLVSPPGDPKGANPRVPGEVRAAAFEIDKANDVLDRVVKSGDKYYVVRLTQKQDARERTFAEAERAIRVRIAQDRSKAKEDETYQSLRKQFPVKIDEAALATVHVDPRALDGGAGGTSWTSAGDAGAK